LGRQIEQILWIPSRSILILLILLLLLFFAIMEAMENTT